MVKKKSFGKKFEEGLSKFAKKKGTFKAEQVFGSTTIKFKKEKPKKAKLEDIFFS